MREILFRGKRVDNDEWVEGSLVHRTQFYGDPDDCYFILYDGEFDCDYYGSVEVDFKTVGQYTGLTDNNGTKIFEGDIVRTLAPNSIDKYIKGMVAFGEYSTAYQSSNVGYYVNWSLNKNLAIYCKINDIEIIGNIHDNPELLKGGEADA